MDIKNYKDVWNQRVSSLKTGAIAVDGSTDEETLLSNGKWTADQMLAALDIKESDTVLELGCGVARIGKILAPHCKKWVGVDISDNMINVAKERTANDSNVEFHVLERNDLKAIEDNSIDKAYSVAVFCHIDKEDLFNYLRELKRIVKPGGLIYIETWNLGSDIGWKRWQYEADNWFISDHSQRKDVSRNQFCSPEEFNIYVQRAGLDTLVSYSDSVWNQIVTGNDLSGAQISEKKSYLEKNREKFEYSQLFSKLFEYAMDVTYNAIHPSEMMSFIDTLGDQPVAELYRCLLYTSPSPRD